MATAKVLQVVAYFTNTVSTQCGSKNVENLGTMFLMKLCKIGEGLKGISCMNEKI